ncbi:hypothetical protein ACFQYP_11680 [Nonomuraea antimicrobica]
MGAVRPDQQITGDRRALGEPRPRGTVLAVADLGHRPAQVEIVADRLGQQFPQGDAVDVHAGVAAEVAAVSQQAAAAVPEGVTVP